MTNATIECYAKRISTGRYHVCKLNEVQNMSMIVVHGTVHSDIANLISFILPELLIAGTRQVTSSTTCMQSVYRSPLPLPNDGRYQ